VRWSRTLCSGNHRKTEDVLFEDAGETGGRAHVGGNRAIGVRFELLDRPRARRSGVLEEVLPSIGLPRQQPEIALAAEGREVPPQGLLQRRRIQRVGERLTERHQQFELGRAHPRLGGFRGGGQRAGFGVLALARLVENQHAAEDRERGQQVDVIPLLHIEPRLPHETKRTLKDHDSAGNEADDERGVVPVDKAHDDSLADRSTHEPTGFAGTGGVRYGTGLATRISEGTEITGSHRATVRTETRREDQSFFSITRTNPLCSSPLLCFSA
jgi:hypothetical protein